MKCDTCKREVTFPSVESIEAAADRLMKNDDGGRGAAAAYLWMIAGCMRGRCLLCQPVTASGFMERSAAVAR